MYLLCSNAFCSFGYQKSGRPCVNVFCFVIKLLFLLIFFMLLLLMFLPILLLLFDFLLFLIFGYVQWSHPKFMSSTECGSSEEVAQAWQLLVDIDGSSRCSKSWKQNCHLHWRQKGNCPKHEVVHETSTDLFNKFLNKQVRPCARPPSISII